jgi:transposase
MSFIRKIKTKSGTYLAEVETYREGGKVKQRFIKYLGREVNNKPAKKVFTTDIETKSVKRSIDVYAIHKLSEKLKINSQMNPLTQALIYSQILDNNSINKLEKWLEVTEIPDILNLKDFSTQKLYEEITNISDLNFGKIEQNLFSIFQDFESIKDAAVIDVTDTYFEGKKIEGKRRKGKESKVRKLIQVGLAVSLKHGFPIFHKTYHGNLSDLQIFKDMTLSLKERGIKSLIMDRGMLSISNLKILLKLELETISGLKNGVKETKAIVKSINREEIYSYKNRVKLKNTSVYIKSFDFMSGTLIVCYNPQLEWIKRESSYEKEDDSEKTKYLGYSLIFHNTKLDNKEVVKKYYEKDVVERAFKQMKGVLNLRPVRAWLKEHVESHVKICYISYAILAYMHYKLDEKFTVIDALEQLKYGYKVKLYDKVNKNEWDLTVPLKPEQEKILKLIECSD